MEMDSPDSGWKVDNPCSETPIAHKMINYSTTLASDTEFMIIFRKDSEF